MKNLWLGTWLTLAMFTCAQGQEQLATPAEAPAKVRDTDVLLEQALAPWTGDWPGIVERGYLRMVVPHNPLFVAYDGDKAIGLAVERARELEKYFKETLNSSVEVIWIPAPRNDLLEFLKTGRGDVVDANLTVTQERAAEVAFTEPLRRDVREIAVTGLGVPQLNTLDDLVSLGLHLRRSSSYYQHLEAINATRRDQGQQPIPVIPVDEALEDRDLLEMVHGGLIPASVVDDHKAQLWAQVFDNLTLHEDVFLHQGGEIAWAVRREAPELKGVLDGFIPSIRKGSLLGNIFDKRYLQSADWVERIDSEESRARLDEVRQIVDQYAPRYDFDGVMILAQIFQESRFDHSAQSSAGAVGLMQVRPSTAADPNVGIGDISAPEDNVHAGVKYLHFVRERYFSDQTIDDLDRVLFSLAAYNAGPANIRKARQRAEAMALDPDVWFDHVEIATARAVSGEPVVYVRNIFKYAVALRLLQEAQAVNVQAEEEILEAIQGAPGDPGAAPQP